MKSPAPRKATSATALTVSSSSVDRPQSTVASSSVAFWLILLLLGAYLFAFTGRITSSDGLSMFAVTESVAKRADFTTDQMWTFFGSKSVPAPDGEVYSKYGYGTSLFALPFYAIALYTSFGGLMQLALLSTAFAIALSGGLLYLTARRLHFSRRVSITLALLFGLATPAWVYAVEFWSEPFALLTLFAAFYCLLVYRDTHHWYNALFSGILLGLALAVRTTNILLVPLYLWYGWNTFRRAKELPPPKRRAKTSKPAAPAAPFVDPTAPRQIYWRDLLAFVLPLVFFALTILAYNQMRFGNPFTTGYRPDEGFTNPLLLGIYGLLFSPGKGLFLYIPFLAALPFGIWQFYQRFRRELIFILILFVIYLLLFSAWYYWWGGTNWAARFLVPTLPFLVLLCAPLLELVLTRPKTLARYALTILFALLVLISFLNEVAGVSINSLTYRLHALSLSPNPDWDAIFSPALSPLRGYWEIFKPTNLEFAWLRATPDAYQVDWLALGITLAFIVFCAYMLIQTVRGQALPSIVPRTTAVIVVLLLGFLMLRYANDPRYGGNAGYQSLLQKFQLQAGPSDVLVLNDDAHARYFFNTNRALNKWYGLSRDPARWDAPTQALVNRLVKDSPHLWFAYDDSVNAPNPMRDWFAANLQSLRVLSFNDGVHLVEYQGATP